MPASLARVSTPGKLILMGEHSAVYGGPALTAALGLRLVATLERHDGADVELDLQAIGHQETLGAHAIVEYGAGQRAAWESYAANPSPEAFAVLDDGEPGRLARVALAECAATLGTLEGLRLRVTSDLPLGSGCGSSAAAAIAIVAAAHALVGAEVQWSTVGPRAFEVERRQHGFPSGVDATTVFHGGALSALRVEEELTFEPLDARADLLRCFAVVNTGVPAESTGEVVASVASRRRAAEKAFDGILGTMRDTAVRFRELLTGATTSPSYLLEPIRTYQRCLEEIGVVPGPVAEIARRIERLGGAAKISGAGALSGDAAGCMLVLMPDNNLPDGLVPLRANLAAEGVRVESVA